MASKSPNKHWKTADWNASGQLKTLEKEQADLLKSFSRHPNEQKYKLVEDSVPIENELLELEKKLKAEILSESEKQILCDQAERLLEKLDENFAGCLRILKTKACHYGFTNFSNARSHY